MNPAEQFRVPSYRPAPCEIGPPLAVSRLLMVLALCLRIFKLWNARQEVCRFSRQGFGELNSIGGRAAIAGRAGAIGAMDRRCGVAFG